MTNEFPTSKYYQESCKPCISCKCCSRIIIQSIDFKIREYDEIYGGEPSYKPVRKYFEEILTEIKEDIDND